MKPSEVIEAYRMYPSTSGPPALCPKYSTFSPLLSTPPTFISTKWKLSVE